MSKTFTNQEVFGKRLHEDGTSEGARKGWQSRGGGATRQKMDGTMRSATGMKGFGKSYASVRTKEGKKRIGAAHNFAANLFASARARKRVGLGRVRMVGPGKAGRAVVTSRKGAVKTVNMW